MKHVNYSRLSLAIKAVREVYADFPIPQLLVFLEVAQAPEGLTVAQVKQRTGLSQSSTSRHCRGLTKSQTPKKTGLDLAEWQPCPNDFRSKLLVLNEKGRELERKLDQAMQ